MISSPSSTIPALTRAPEKPTPVEEVELA